MDKILKNECEIIDNAALILNIVRINNFIDKNTPIKWKCNDCSKIKNIAPKNILKSSYHCTRCFGKPITNEKIDNLLKLKNIKIKRIDNYNGLNKIQWQCQNNNCYKIWKTTFAGLHGCPYCAIKNKSKSNEYVDSQLLLNNIPIKRLGEYSSNKIKIQWQCLKTDCNYIWITTTKSILHIKSGCPKCCGNYKHSNEIIDNKLINKNIKRLDNYVSAYTMCNWQCLKCNHIWISNSKRITYQERGCPKCNIPGVNEKAMHNLLEQSFKNEYKVQYKIRNINNEARNCIFDAYIPNLRIAIEYNGTQHYSPTGFSKNRKDPDVKKLFINQIERDNYKRNFCKDNNIKLIEIDGRKYFGEKLINYLKLDIIPYIKSEQN